MNNLILEEPDHHDDIGDIEEVYENDECMVPREMQFVQAMRFVVTSEDRNLEDEHNQLD